MINIYKSFLSDGTALFKEWSSSFKHHYQKPANLHSFLDVEIADHLTSLPDVLGRCGSLEVRLAHTKKDIKRAQKLRFKVFYEEMSAIPNPAVYLTKRDKDVFDSICDHLIVLDYDVPTKPFRKSKPKVVGTYRLLRQDVASRNFGFYSAGEFDLSDFINAHKNQKILELGRSCVLKDYRSKRILDLLWRGLYTYMTHYNIGFMLGCASFEGTDPTQHKLGLSFLHHHSSAKAVLRPQPLVGQSINMDILPEHEVDTKKALKSLPPLIKGYLRAGAIFGDGAVIDWQFNTIDVLVLMKVDDIKPSYINHYKSETTDTQTRAVEPPISPMPSITNAPPTAAAPLCCMSISRSAKDLGSKGSGAVV